MPCMDRKGDETNFGGDHCPPFEWEKVVSMCPFTSHTLKPTFAQSVAKIVSMMFSDRCSRILPIALVGGGGKLSAMMNDCGIKFQVNGQVDVVDLSVLQCSQL